MEQQTQNDKLQLYPGMMVEVMTLTNQLTFVGKVESFTRTSITVCDSAGRELPPVLYNKEIKMRLFHGQENTVIHGKICGSTRWIWKVDQLQNQFVSEKRNFFRQTVNLNAQVSCTKRSPLEPKLRRGVHPGKCRILDISAGGVLVESREPFQLGDKLSITDAVVVAEEKPFTFLCFVRRVVQDGSKFLFGCQFDAMSAKEQDRLLRAIFIVQRKEIQTQRVRGASI